MFVQHALPPPLLDGKRDSLGKEAGLFDQLDDCQANELQCVHKVLLAVLGCISRSGSSRHKRVAARLERGSSGIAVELHGCFAFRFDLLVAVGRLPILFLR